MQRGANHVSRNPWITTFTNGYEVWARLKGQKTNVGMSIISQNYGEANLRYYTDVCHAFYGAMIARLRAIGLRIPINANNWFSWPWEILAGRLQASWTPTTITAATRSPRLRPSVDYGFRIRPGCMARRLAHSPSMPFPARLTSKEWGNNPPKTYRAAYPLGVAAIALQDWDGFTGYAYSQSASPASTLSAYEWEARSCPGCLDGRESWSTAAATCARRSTPSGSPIRC